MEALLEFRGNMMNILKMLAFTLSNLFASMRSEESAEARGEQIACALLFSAHLANVGFVLMVWFPEVMQYLASRRNATVLLSGLLSLPYYFRVKRLISSIRREFDEDEVLAAQAQQRWRLPALLYLAVSWISFVAEIVVLASRRTLH